jgi:Cu+-exporting ATPase
VRNGEIDRFGLILIADEVKHDSADAMAMLHRMGMQTVLLTGDNRVAATAVGKQVGIDQIHAEVRPDGKSQIIQDLQQNKHRVAMVGDGINDAPALAQADLGIALGSGADIAKEVGQIVLVSPSLKNVAFAISLSRATMSKIRQNLFLALVYNVLAIPLAAFGVLNPLIAAAAMALSDVSVIGNSLLLAKKKLD